MVRKLSEGAEAVVYEQDAFSVPAVEKRRIRKAYRVPELDSQIREHRTKAEARILLSLHGTIDVPRVLFVGKDTIVMERIDGSKLSDMDVDGALPRAYMGKAGASLARMHAANVTHGDYTPANLIASKGKVYVIDFGLSYVTNSIEDKALDLLLMKRSVNAESFAAFMKGYRKIARDANMISRKLAEIEMRGRYQSRSLATIN